MRYVRMAFCPENTARPPATHEILESWCRYSIAMLDDLHGKALENELDIPMSSEWRT